jgi:hypothetical protein
MSLAEQNLREEELAGAQLTQGATKDLLQAGRLLENTQSRNLYKIKEQTHFKGYPTPKCLKKILSHKWYKSLGRNPDSRMQQQKERGYPHLIGLSLPISITRFVPECRDDKDRQSAGSGAKNGSQSVNRGPQSVACASEAPRPF